MYYVKRIAQQAAFSVLTSKMQVVNTATSVRYNFVVGSAEERELFRVTPVDGTSKMYFDSKEQYITWRQKQLDEREHLQKLGIYMIPGLVAK